LIFRLRLRGGRPAQETHQIRRLGLGRPPFQKLLGGLNGPDFFCDRYRDELMSETPSSFARRAAAALTDLGIFSKYEALLIALSPCKSPAA
jgi:hypothetical protein